MAAYDRRSFAGGAVATTITAGINGSDLTISIAASTGWPTGSAGEYGVILDRGTASEEKILVTTRSSLTLTVPSGGRGVDGTSAVSHTTGATAEVVLLARDLDEANAHIADDALDHHSQYLNSTRHDVEARHAFGGALGTPDAPASIGTSNATGSGNNPAREDHVHEIGTGAIDTSAMFAAGVVDAAAIAANAVGSSELADNAVDTGAIADNAVTTAKIADDQITGAKIADGAIDASAMFASGVVDAAAIAANAIGTSELADNAVDTGALAAAAVTMAKMASEAGTSYTPTLTGVTLGTGGTRFGRYFKFGRLVVGVAGFSLGTGGNVTASILLSVPFQCANTSGVDWVMAARAIDTATGTRASGLGLVEANATVGGGFATIGTSIWGATAPFDWQDGSQLWAVFVYESAT